MTIFTKEKFLLSGQKGITDLYFRDCERVMDQMVAPMRFLHMDSMEFVAMKACVLFDPGSLKKDLG